MSIIAVDIDCVINNLMDKTLEMYNKQSNKNIQMSDLTSYNLYDCLKKEDANGIVKLFKNKALWDSLTPIEGARDGLKKLVDDGHKVYVVTATAPENFAWKIQWIKKYFPFFNTDNVIRMMDKSLIRADILVDDCLDQLLAHKMCYRVCVDYPWNRNITDFIYDIRRCKDWNEILKTINQIKREKEEYERENYIS